jgi:hypothetical protein
MSKEEALTKNTTAGNFENNREGNGMGENCDWQLICPKIS